MVEKTKVMICGSDSRGARDAHGWAKINDKAEVEEEVFNGVFVVLYPYVKAVDETARPHLRK